MKTNALGNPSSFYPKFSFPLCFLFVSNCGFQYTSNVSAKTKIKIGSNSSLCQGNNCEWSLTPREKVEE